MNLDIGNRHLEANKLNLIINNVNKFPDRLNLDRANIHLDIDNTR